MHQLHRLYSDQLSRQHLRRRSSDCVTSMGGHQIAVAAEEENCRRTDVPCGIGVCISPFLRPSELIIRANIILG